MIKLRCYLIPAVQAVSDSPKNRCLESSSEMPSVGPCPAWLGRKILNVSLFLAKRLATLPLGGVVPHIQGRILPDLHRQTVLVGRTLLWRRWGNVSSYSELVIQPLSLPWPQQCPALTLLTWHLSSHLLQVIPTAGRLHRQWPPSPVSFSCSVSSSSPREIQ